MRVEGFISGKVVDNVYVGMYLILLKLKIGSRRRWN